MNREIINSLKDVLPLLKDMLREDIAISITDTEKFIAYYPNEKIPMKLSVGDKIQEGDPYLEAMRTKKVTSNILPKRYLDLYSRVYAIHLLMIMAMSLELLVLPKALKSRQLFRSPLKTFSILWSKLMQVLKK